MALRKFVYGRWLVVYYTRNIGLRSYGHYVDDEKDSRH